MAKVAVFGAGPAGLLAAHAARQAGNHVDIFAAGPKSTLYGAQYLHREIPGIPCGEPRSIVVKLAGTAEGYREKVYGESYTGLVSPSALENGHLAWDIRAAYDWLWGTYKNQIMELTITRTNGPDVYTGSITEYDFVFCSIPLMQLCITEPGHLAHSWEMQQVYAIGDAPDLNIRCPVNCPDETMRYDGTKDVGWYRSARIFDHTTCEWPARKAGRKPPISNLAAVFKPLSTNCTCFPKWIRIGRYGQWKKGVLVHQAYELVQQTLDIEMGDGGQLAIL